MTATSTTENGAAQLTARERNELVRIVKGRFKLLRTGAKARAMQLVQAEQAAAKLAGDEQAREFEKRARPLAAKIRKLQEELADVESEAVRAGYYRTTLSDGSLAFRGRGDVDYSDYYAVEQHVLAEIDRAELTIIEELLLGGLESEAARSFMAEIPTVDALVEKGLAVLPEPKRLLLTQA